MRHCTFHTILAAMLAVSSCGKGAGDTPAADAADAMPAAVDTIPLLVKQVKRCSRLYTAEYKIHKIVTYDDIVRFKGKVFDNEFDIEMPLGDRKIAIPMDAKLKAYIDFSNFSESNIVRNGKSITVVLPDPQVVLTSSKIDQKNIREFVSITRSSFSDKEITDFENQGRKSILANVGKLGIVKTARENAARMIVPIFKDMGYKEEDITIVLKEHDGGDFGYVTDKSTVER